ncbi:hypothetical protein RF55_21048 [Lasius niger]|uniref:Uncharacterized protein n=1 Tax=Lasius niger TaxID=67767 RepID=A0A0J7JYC4_LASNI|nr:hypothetical protein RF55_21048 [Lasius niger]
MGNYMTKLLLHTNESQKESNEQAVKQQMATDSSMCTPTLPEKRVLCDPRSISSGISRTPIEVKCTPVAVTKRAPTAIPEYLQKKKYLETDMDVVMPPLSPRKHLVPKLIDSDQRSDSVCII